MYALHARHPRAVARRGCMHAVRRGDLSAVARRHRVSALRARYDCPRFRIGHVFRLPDGKLSAIVRRNHMSDLWMRRRRPLYDQHLPRGERRM